MLRYACVFATPLLASLAALSVLAQTAAPTSSASAPGTAITATPLLPPAGLYYQYWPMQIVQFVGPELPYSMIVLYVDDRPKSQLHDGQPGESSYDATLTERASGKRIHYVNKPELVAEDKSKGDEAYLTHMQLDQPAEPAKNAQYLLRFNTEKGIPVLWQFVQGTDISEQGSGLTPIEAPVPVLVYREQGALAAEGTALKIGDVTSAADVWKEYAQPPYFVPYHGALSLGVHILLMTPVASRWTGEQPGALAEGTAWKLSSAAGTLLGAHVDSVKGAAAFVSLINERKETTTTLDAQQASGGWAVSRVRFGPAGAKPEHTLSLAFTPSLSVGTASRFDVLAGKKTKVASGMVQTGAGDGGAVTEKWVMTAPDSVKGKTATASATLQH